MANPTEIPTPHPILGYSVHREDFTATRSTLKISTGELGETRELHITTEPKSAQLRRTFGSLIFRLVDGQLARRTDAYGKPIVGGLNSYPEPIHVVLRITPAAIEMLNQRLSAGRKVVISICPASNILEWSQEEALLIYEAMFIAD